VEERAEVLLRKVSVSEVMAILDTFPEKVPSYLSPHRRDTTLLMQLYGFSEVIAPALRRVFPSTRFYLGQDFSWSTPCPYLMAISGRKRYAIGSFNQLLVDSGLEMNDACSVDLAKAFVIMVLGSERNSFPEITFMRASTVAGRISENEYTTRLDVLIGDKEEQWYFRSAYGRVMGASRRNDKTYIKGYTFSDVRLPPDN
jgi:hypothetical protein